MDDLGKRGGHPWQKGSRAQNTTYAKASCGAPVIRDTKGLDYGGSYYLCAQRALQTGCATFTLPSRRPRPEDYTLYYNATKPDYHHRDCLR